MKYDSLNYLANYILGNPDKIISDSIIKIYFEEFENLNSIFYNPNIIVKDELRKCFKAVQSLSMKILT